MKFITSPDSVKFVRGLVLYSIHLSMSQEVFC